MDKIKCITFDKAAQDSLLEHIKAKMKEDREKARADNILLHLKKGRKFTGQSNLYFTGVVKPCSVDELTNLLHVRLYYKGSEWEEGWDLSHVVYALEQGIYEWIDSVTI